MLEGLLDSEAELTETLNLTGMLPGFTISLKNKPNLSNLIVGESLEFRDARDKKRSLIVLQKLTPSKVRIGLPRTAYLDEGIELESGTSGKFAIGTVKPQPVEIRVKLGDHLRLYRDPRRFGAPAFEGSAASISWYSTGSA